MPIYLYKLKKGKKGCSFCSKVFEWKQKMTDEPLQCCPRCGASVEKLLSNFYLSPAKTDLDNKAKGKGFHKLKRVDKGKYEKLY